MSDLLQLLKDFLPVEVAVIAAIFIYLLLLFKGIAEKFISIAERQTRLAEMQAKYLQERLNVVEKTLGISDRAFDLQEKQIRKLQEITQQQQDELAESIMAKQVAEARLTEAEERYQEAVLALDLKAQQVVELQAAQTRVELTSRAEAIARLAHELLLPVQSVMADADNLRAAEKLDLVPEERAHIAKRIINQMQRLALQLQNARVSVGIGEEEIYSPTNFSMYGLVQECINLFIDEARAKQVILQVESISPDDSFTVTGDKSKLRLALCNVIGNAVKYSFGGTDVTVRIERKDGSTRVIVANTGLGISSEEMEKIIELGYRVPLGLDRSRTGTGMGLLVAKQIISAHSGQLQLLSSERTNQGYRTVFEIVLPSTHQEISQ
jgi:signal transduction histidine kinase